MNKRKRAKRAKLLARQRELIADYVQLAYWESPYETISQARHERRVIGHSVLDCARYGCTLDKITAAIGWNQPPSVEGGAAYQRRRNSRRKRRHRDNRRKRQG